MGKINKKDVAEPQGRVHKRNELPDDLLRFSFRHLAANEKFGHAHASDGDAYLGQLLERLQSLSGMKLSEFRTNKDKALRAHTHRWPDTTEKAGYSHLTEQLRDCEPWQFQLSVNEHGRVHGILIDEVFYVVWLDPQHRLYA